MTKPPLILVHVSCLLDFVLLGERFSPTFLLILAKYPLLPLSLSLFSLSLSLSLSLFLSLSFEEVDDEEELGDDEKEMLAYLQQ